MKSKFVFLGVAVVAILFVFTAAYVVDETEQVVVTQFGKVVGKPKTESGLYFKIPFIQNATYFPKNLLEWDGDPGQIPTLDKTYIWVDTFARWRIVDPIKFFQTVNNTTSAQGRLDDIIDPAVRNLITENRLVETVRKTNREVDTYDKRINYVEQVRNSVYGRMIAERKQIAEKFRSEGKGEAKKILGEKERDLKRITSEAYRKAQILKGKADGESTRLYAEAFGIDPDFYSFVKTLEIYDDALGKDSSLLLSTDSEFFKYLKGYSGKQ